MFQRLFVVVGVCGMLGGLSPTTALAQPCDDFNECTTNSICQEDNLCGGGVPVANGTPCGQSSNPCVTNPTCFEGTCSMGAQAPDGTPCKFVDSPCVTEGTCQPVVPGVPLSLCVGSMFRTCPQDADPCTAEFCNFETGECDSGPSCFATIEAPDFQCADATCNPANGQCSFTFKNEGGSCDDFIECTANSRCVEGDCLSGEPTGPTPTPTAEPTPTSVPGACVGDCNDDGSVAIDDLIVMVNIAQDAQPITACLAGDADMGGTITIEEIIQAVGNAQTSC